MAILQLLVSIVSPIVRHRKAAFAGHFGETAGIAIRLWLSVCCVSCGRCHTGRSSGRFCRKKGSDLPVAPGLLGGLKGRSFPAGRKTPGHNHAESQITSKSPAKPPRSLEGAASERTRGRGWCRAPALAAYTLRARVHIRLQPSSDRTPPEEPGRPWWWGRRRRPRAGSRTGERWPCACRFRSSRAPPASSCARPAQARPC